MPERGRHEIHHGDPDVHTFTGTVGSEPTLLSSQRTAELIPDHCILSHR